MSEGDKLSANAQTRLSGHANLMLALSSMVAAELTVADGLSDVDATMATAQVFIACAAQTACAAVRDYLGRDPDKSKWMSSCDEAFQRAVAVVRAQNVPKGDPS